MDLTLYSKYRTPLMGLAMLMVILYHQIGKPANFSDGVSCEELICSIFHGGTDIFLFFSGMGLYFAMKKRPKMKDFYKRRIVRIIPCYYIVIWLIAIFSINISPLEVLEQMGIFGFFFPFLHISSYDWFIPSILFLYGIFPFYFKSFDSSPKTHTLLACLIGLLLTSILIFIQKGTIIQLFSRIPIFFIGTYIGYALYNKRPWIRYSKLMIAIITVSVIALTLLMYLTIYYENDSVILRKNGITHLPWIFICPGFCLLGCLILNTLQNIKYVHALNFILTFIGSISLEIYLIHMGLPRTVFGTREYLELNILTILIAYSISVFSKFLIDKFIIPQRK